MWPLRLTLALALSLGCAGTPTGRDAVGVSHLLPLADPMGPGETALGRCVGAISTRGALLKSCDDLGFLLRDQPGPLTPHPAPEYRREVFDSSIGSRNAYLELGARYAWSVERLVRSSRSLEWRPEAEISDEEIQAIWGACRGAARGGHIVVAEYHGCGVLVSSGDLSIDPPRTLDSVFEAKLASGEFETRGSPQDFLLLSSSRNEADFDPGAARCGETATLLVKTRSLADLCLERVPGLVDRSNRRRQEAMFTRIGHLERANGELDALLGACRERGDELAHHYEAERLANAELRSSEGETARRLAVETATHAATAQAVLESRRALAACERHPSEPEAIAAEPVAAGPQD